jgi:hypothetical protein
LSAGESASGALHRVASFSGSVDSTAAVSAVSSLSDPTITSGATGYANFSNKPLFSHSGPAVGDVVQGQLGDCYLLASLASVAKVNPQVIRNNVVDLGDGTYAVQFTADGVKSYVRVDADLPTNSWGNVAYAQLGAQDSLWVAIFEKAYAFYRYGDAKYASIEGGFMADVYDDMGLDGTSMFGAPTAQGLMTRLQQELAAGNAVTFGTKNDADELVIISGHAYMVDAVLTNSSGQFTGVRLRNPWGFDGAGHDGNTSDGYVTLTPTQAQQVFWFACIADA